MSEAIDMCSECFWYWTDNGKKVCHNENMKALKLTNNNNRYCNYFEDKFLGNPPTRDVTEDFSDGRW